MMTHPSVIARSPAYGGRADEAISVVVWGTEIASPACGGLAMTYDTTVIARLDPRFHGDAIQSFHDFLDRPVKPDDDGVGGSDGDVV